MLRREEGWVLDGSHSDIWKKTEDRDGHTMYSLYNLHTSLLLFALDTPTPSPINNKTLHHLVSERPFSGPDGAKQATQYDITYRCSSSREPGP